MTNLSEDTDVVPVKWKRLVKLFEKNSWKVNRISGSHYIFVKPGRRCIPLAFHGNRALTRRYAKLVLRQAQIIGATEELPEVGDDDHNDEDDGDEAAEEVENTSRSRLERKEKRGEKLVKPIPASKALTSLTEEEKEKLIEQRRLQNEAEIKIKRSRQELLEQVQSDVATGRYGKAVASIDKEEIDLDSVGSSDDKYEFQSDLMFFKLVSLTEISFEHTFGSPEQRESIFATLKLSSKYMEAVHERRQEARSLSVALQERAISLYLQRANEACVKYNSVVFRDEIIADKLYSTIFQSAVAEEVPRTQKFVYNQLDIILESLHVVVSMYNLVREQPFRPEHAMAEMEKLSLTNFIPPCIRRMLVLFDMEEFDAASRAADDLLFVGQHFKEAIAMNDMVSSLAFCLPMKARMKQEMIVGIAEHIKALVPAYRYAKKELNWSRVAGVFARCSENDNFDESDKRHERCSCTVGGAVAFVDMIVDAIEKSHHISMLVQSNMTSTFMFDTFVDCVDLLHLSTQDLVMNGRAPVGKKMLELMKGMYESNCDSVEEYSARKGRNYMKEFRGSKYDTLRRQTLVLLKQLQKLSNIYTSYYTDIDEQRRTHVDKSNMSYSRFRYVHINKARYNLVHLFNLLFEKGSASFRWMYVYKSLAVLLSDLDVADQFDTGIPTTLRGQCDSAEESIGIGRYSFTLVFQTMVPSFLQHYVIDGETKELYIIDGIGSKILEKASPRKNTNLPWLDPIESLECASFALLSQLLKRGARSVPESFVRSTLRQLGQDSKCPEFRRWVKNKAKRYSTKIDGLLKVATGKESELSCCMENREKAVHLLLIKLKACILTQRKLPSDVEAKMNSGSRKELYRLLAKHGHCLYQWSYKDAEEINWAMWALQDAAQETTSFLHQALRFPIVKSLSNPSWNQHDSLHILDDLSKDQQHVVADAICIHDIIKFANDSDAN